MPLTPLNQLKRAAREALAYLNDRNDRGEQVPDLIPVKTYAGRPEAELGKNFLSTQGIRATVIADDAGGLRPELLLGMGGARLLVQKDDAKKAIELLGSHTNKKGRVRKRRVR